MWIVQKKFAFEAAHKLPYHDGKCRRLHGHSFQMTVAVVGRLLHSQGCKSNMLLDFGDIKSLVNPILEDYLDHHYLNETTGLQSPTSEALARWVFYRLDPLVRNSRGVLLDPRRPGIYADSTNVEVSLSYVRIDETCTSSATYFAPTMSGEKTEIVVVDEDTASGEKES